MGDHFRVSDPRVVSVSFSGCQNLYSSFSCLVLISSNLEQLLVTVLSLRTDFSNQVTVRVVCKLVFFPCNRGAIIKLKLQNRVLFYFVYSLF